MAYTSSPVEFNSFSKGLNTDSSPLNYQPGSASSLTNFNLNLDGTVSRRLGYSRVLVDYSELEAIYQDGGDSWYAVGAMYTGEDVRDTVKSGAQTFLWGGAGPSGEDYIVVSFQPLSGNIVFQRLTEAGLVRVPCTDTNDVLGDPTRPAIFTSSDTTPSVDFTVIGSKLVAVASLGWVYLAEFDGIRVNWSRDTLKVRDVWGVNDVTVGGVDLNEEVQVRPQIVYTNSQAESDTLGRHWYNLFNQGWGDLSTPDDSETESFPFSQFNTKYISLYGAGNAGTWPANSDVLTEYLYPKTDSTTGSKTVDRYHAEDMIRGKSDSRKAPRGHFVIDLLDRGVSRQANFDKVKDVAIGRGATLVGPWLDGLKEIDSNSILDGPSTVASAAGRVWYAGFGNTLTNAFSGAPDLSKLVLFSQLASNDSNALKCYQQGDPTSKEDADIVDTDGGFIVIQEAEGINKIVEFGTGVLVFAANGVWSVAGTDTAGFTATGYEVSKVSTFGCIVGSSVAVAGDKVFYLSGSGLRAVVKTELGTLASTDVSTGLIGEHISNFNVWQLNTFKGSYAERDNKVYFNYLTSVGSEELIFDLNLNAFYKHEILEGSDTPNALLLQTLPLPQVFSNTAGREVVIGADEVLVGGEQVVSGFKSGSSKDTPVGLLKLIYQRDYNNNRYQLGFGVEGITFNDWEVFPTYVDNNLFTVPTPEDAEAHLVTGYLTGGDTQRNKSVPYLTTLFNKTETGFEEDVLGDLYPANPSSCLIQAQWEWATSATSGRWGREFQAYRHKRYYIPESGADQYEDGHSVVTTKNKIRGKGRALSFKMTTEPDKDCQILGWSMNLGIGDAV